MKKKGLKVNTHEAIISTYKMQVEFLKFCVYIKSQKPQLGNFVEVFVHTCGENLHLWNTGGFFGLTCEQKVHLHFIGGDFTHTWGQNLHLYIVGGENGFFRKSKKLKVDDFGHHCGWSFWELMFLLATIFFNNLFPEKIILF